MNLKAHIRTIPDFPKPGILFYDITTLLMNAEAFQHALDKLHEVVKQTKPDHIVAIESRGFLFGAPLAALSKIGLVLVRKKGNSRGMSLATPTTSNTAPIPSRFRKVSSSRAIKC